MFWDHSSEEGIRIIPWDRRVLQSLTVPSNDEAVGISAGQVHALKHKLLESSVNF